MIKFGDINLIKEIKKQEKLKKSKDWKVSIRITGEDDIIVKGIEDKKEAMDKAYDQGFDELISTSEAEITDARKIIIEKPENKNRGQMKLFKWLKYSKQFPNYLLRGVMYIESIFKGILSRYDEELKDFISW